MPRFVPSIIRGVATTATAVRLAITTSSSPAVFPKIEVDCVEVVVLVTVGGLEISVIAVVVELVV